MGLRSAKLMVQSICFRRYSLKIVTFFLVYKPKTKRLLSFGFSFDEVLKAYINNGCSSSSNLPLSPFLSVNVLSLT
ncbi:hypothetical protein CARUB_v10010804mg [Capsella rubella]|uniref:Uncharacterized protein n=1 Tax=Capsella rubella TaxID=81985 RepID=R0INK2_9BRAS|nr:hypothetical protein CARUB_v10010804mg [Capsella rubella]